MNCKNHARGHEAECTGADCGQVRVRLRYRAELYLRNSPIELDVLGDLCDTRAEAEADGQDLLHRCDAAERDNIDVVVRETYR